MRHRPMFVALALITTGACRNGQAPGPVPSASATQEDAGTPPARRSENIVHMRMLPSQTIDEISYQVDTLYTYRQAVTPEFCRQLDWDGAILNGLESVARRGYITTDRFTCVARSIHTRNRPAVRA